SGESVVMLKNKYKIENKNILIMLDDIDLDVGKLRYRKSGSGGTHNGLKNIVQLLGSADVQRIRFGIGNDKKMDLADYVLSKINDENSTKIDAAIFESKDVLLKEFFDAK
ncbi:MAG: aminoacyl-tRNA hydrolase, partial [Clostridia bacterium]